MTGSIPPFISIIIANYNGEKYLPTCLSSVLNTKYPMFEIIVIDDGSTDKGISIIEKFQKKDKRINLLKNTKNIGAAASRNKAVKEAKGDLLVFLDNDTEVDARWLSEMVATMAKNKNIGACQAVLYDFQKRDIIQNAGVKLWAATGWGLPHHQWEKDNGQLKNIKEILAISAALAVKKNVFLLTKGFDEREAVVTEDLDLVWRIWILGYKVILSPKSKVYHWTKPVSMRKNMKHSATTIYFHLTKNSLLSISKNYEFGNVLKYLFTSIIISLGRSGIVLLKRREADAFVGSLKGLGWFLSHIPYVIKQREYIQRTRKVKDQDLFKRVILQESILGVYKKYFISTNLL